MPYIVKNPRTERTCGSDVEALVYVRILAAEADSLGESYESIELIEKAGDLVTYQENGKPLVERARGQ